MSFFQRYKKVFLIIGFLLLVFIIAHLLWSLFFQTNNKTSISQKITPGQNGVFPEIKTGSVNIQPSGNKGVFPENTGSQKTNSADSVAQGGVTKTKAITQSPVAGPTLSKNGGLQYYNPKDGLFYHLDENGHPSLMSDKIFHNVKKVVWAGSKDKAILEYPDGRKILYNFQTKKQVTLPSHWHDFSFSPDSNRIISKNIALDPENNWLVVSKDDGSQARTLENIGTNGDTVFPNWSPNNQIAAMYTKGIDFNRQEVFFVGLNNENFKSTVIEGRGFEGKWSTTGDNLLYSVYSTKTNLNPQLWLVNSKIDTIGQNRHSIGLSTWANKCTFASNNDIYCAVPENLERGAGMFPELANKTKDDLYHINTKTGTKELIAVPNGSYNISQIMVSKNGNKLYFTDNKSKRLYQVRLH